ncbi:MAG: zinc ribbon domain-containing protein [Clostridiales Family XIII bacterium]|jgi:hypothetical protein|nr:zinc ribbon domain-containing protein [Clostridiales Family XIII bacterium]
MANNYNQAGSGASPGGAPDDGKSVGFGILGFFFPLIGLILFLVWRKDKPKKAKSCGIGALIGFVLQIILYILVVPPLLAAMSLVY